jgi:hypothetical protein
MKILIVGGYGTFGGRLVDLLASDERLQIHVAGRSFAKAQAFIASRSVAAKLIALAFDREMGDAQLRELKPDLVVDASGPFQVYGAAPYRLVQDCIGARCNYIDLADGAEFVEGISKFDAAAKAAGVFVLSGMSSFPVLTAAVVRKLAKDINRVETITAGIAPSPYAGVGMNVIRAIASYAGQPVDILQNGAWMKRAGFWDSRRMVVNVPGEVPLLPIRFALTEVPDLKVLSWERPEVQSIWMGAGPTPAIMHRLLWTASGLVKMGVLKSLLPLAPLMNWVVNTVRWGEHRGGMIVEVTGQAGEKRSWHLLAEGEGGPLVPSIAAQAIVLRCLANRKPVSGARSGHQDLEIGDYAPLLAQHGIKTGVRELVDGETNYQTVMGESFGRLAQPIQHMHSGSKAFSVKGKADVSGGDGVLARLARFAIGFPACEKNVDVRVDFEFIGDREIWTRHFGDAKFVSQQFKGQGRYTGLMVEKFGPLSFGMAVVERDGTLHLRMRGGDVLGIPLPRFLWPRIAAQEHGADGKFNFDVDISLPVVGQVVHYQGWLAP